MPVPSTYLTTIKNLNSIMAAIQKAGVPDLFTHEFLKQLGFSSSSDRPIIKLLKDLHFLDENGKPTDRYLMYKDPAQAKRVLAEAIRATYVDIFTVSESAQDISKQELKGIFGRVSGASNSVADKMALTFSGLVDLADFNALPQNGSDEEHLSGKEEIDGASAETPPAVDTNQRQVASFKATLHHDIHLHLPNTTNVAVYDAIFISLKRNLGA